jgi:SAM-dependent methyltransferase
MPGRRPERVSHVVIDPYRDIVEFYDLEHDEFELDSQMYIRFAEVVGDPILEVACGTGRILAALARQGHRVVGADASEPMLERARARLSSHSPATQYALHCVDMIDVDTIPGGPFGIIVIGLDSLLHLTSQEEQIAALAAAHQALDPRGMLLIDCFNPTPRRLMELEGSLSHDGTWQADSDRRVDKFSSRRVFPANQELQTTLWYDVTSLDGSLKRFATSFELRYLHPAELALMLEKAGFVEWQLYGDYELSELDDEAERIIVAAEVTASAQSDGQ